MTTTHIDDHENPFIAAAEAGLESEMDRLATIVSCAHRPDDVYAGCRVERALARLDSEERGTLSSYLDGIYFAPVLGGSYDISQEQLDTLRELAWSYLERNELAEAV